MPKPKQANPFSFAASEREQLARLNIAPDTVAAIERSVGYPSDVTGLSFEELLLHPMLSKRRLGAASRLRQCKRFLKALRGVDAAIGALDEPTQIDIFGGKDGYWDYLFGEPSDPRLGPGPWDGSPSPSPFPSLIRHVVHLVDFWIRCEERSNPPRRGRPVTTGARDHLAVRIARVLEGAGIKPSRGRDSHFARVLAVALSGAGHTPPTEMLPLLRTVHRRLTSARATSRQRNPPAGKRRVGVEEGRIANLIELGYLKEAQSISDRRR